MVLRYLGTPAWQRIVVEAPSDAGDSAWPLLSGYPLPADLRTGTEDHGSGGASPYRIKNRVRGRVRVRVRLGNEKERGGSRAIAESVFLNQEFVRV